MPISISTNCNPQPNCNGCENLPDVSFSICAPQVNMAEITHVYLAMPDQELLDENNANEWGARLAMTSSSKARIIALTVRGEKPSVGKDDVEGPFNKKFRSHLTHQATFETSESNDTNYAFMRYFQYQKNCTVWYKTAGGMLFGGKGIKAAVELDHLIPANAGDLEKITGVITWQSKRYPCRTASVI